MSTHRLVYHITDKDLFQIFIRGIAHKVLLEPMRSSLTLRNKYFKGYRVTDHFPAKEALSNAYFTELNTGEDLKLLNFLCEKWVYSHPDLSKSGFGVLDIEFSPDTDWLECAHEYLSQHGHQNAAKLMVKSLAIAYPPPEILIFISIISYEYEKQAELRKFVEDEIILTQSNPHVLRDHLQNQLVSIMSRMAALKNSIEDIECQKQTRDAAAEKQSSAYKADLKQIHDDLQDSESKLTAARKELDAINEKIKEQSARASGLKQRNDKLESQMEHAQAKLREDREADRSKLSKLQTDHRASAEEEHRIQDQITTLEARIREEIEKAELAKVLAKDIDHEAKIEIIDPIDDMKTPAPVEWTTAFSDDLYRIISFSSCVTLDLLWLRSTGLTDLQSACEKPQNDYVAESIRWRDYYVQRSLSDSKGWDRSDLA